MSLFQFHYGTIKRVESSAWSCRTGNFNSIMVRLKVYDPDYTVSHADDFNSIMVRLKETEEA